MNNFVVIKGKRDRLAIYLDDKVDFQTLKNSLGMKIFEAKDFIGNANMAIEFVNRKLKDREENELLEKIKENCELKITYVFSEKKDAKKIEIENIEKPITCEGKTKYYHKTLRSGDKIEYSGNLVILGNVNPGSIVRATGNVIVLGFLNGTVFAGLSGEKDAFVGAIYMNPVQLAIGNIIISPKQEKILDTNKVKKDSDFKIAYLKDGKIVFEDIGKK